MHRLTIGRASKKKLHPRISIQGVWLGKLGWEVGDKVELLENQKEIVLRRIHIPDLKQLKLPHT